MANLTTDDLISIRSLPAAIALQTTDVIPLGQLLNGADEDRGGTIQQLLDLLGAGSGSGGGLAFVFSLQTQPPTEENYEFRLNDADPDTADKLYLGQIDKSGAPIAGIITGSTRPWIYLKSDNPDFYAIGKLGKANIFFNHIEIDIDLFLFSQASFPSGQNIYLNLYPNNESVATTLVSSTIVTPDLADSSYFVLAPTQNFTLGFAQNLLPGIEFKIKIYGGQTMILSDQYKIPAAGYVRSTDPAKYDVFTFVCFAAEEAALTNFAKGFA
jgi:hypothetical protein